MLAKFVIRLLRNETVVDRCCARMKGHGSSSVIKLCERSIVVNDDRFADSSKTLGSTVVMTLPLKDRFFSWCRLTNTPSCSRHSSQHRCITLYCIDLWDNTLLVPQVAQKMWELSRILRSRWLKWPHTKVYVFFPGNYTRRIPCRWFLLHFFIPVIKSATLWLKNNNFMAAVWNINQQRRHRYSLYRMLLKTQRPDQWWSHIAAE